MNTQTAWPRAASLIARASSLAMVALAFGGCSGINASKSISPLDFILPGLMQNVPPAPIDSSATNAPCVSPEFAKASHDLLSLRAPPGSSL